MAKSMNSWGVRQEKVVIKLRGADDTDWWERSPIHQLCTQIFENTVLSKYPLETLQLWLYEGYFEYLQVHWCSFEVKSFSGNASRIVASKVYMRGHGGVADTSITSRNSVKISEFGKAFRATGKTNGRVSRRLMLMISNPKSEPFYGFLRHQMMAISRFVEDTGRMGGTRWSTV